MRLGALLRRIGRMLTRRGHVDTAADARRWMELDRLA
jgi:hypothetical protein